MKESVKQIWCQLNQGMLAEGNFILFQVQTLLLQNIDVSREPVCFIDCIGSLHQQNTPNTYQDHLA